MRLERWRRRWRSWRRLDGAARVRLVQAACALPMIAMGLRVAGYNRTLWALARSTPLLRGGTAQQDGPALQALIAESAWAVAAAAHHAPFSTTCLQRSMTLWWLLRRRGIGSDLRIGVTKAGGEFGAHAWLERDGEVINDDMDVGERFVAFDSLPGVESCGGDG